MQVLPNDFSVMKPSVVGLQGNHSLIDDIHSRLVLSQGRLCEVMMGLNTGSDRESKTIKFNSLPLLLFELKQKFAFVKCFANTNFRSETELKLCCFVITADGDIRRLIGRNS